MRRDLVSVLLGALVDSDASLNSDRRWEIVAMSLPAGRYVIRVTGTTNTSETTAYTGQLAFVPSPVRSSFLVWVCSASV